MATIKTITTISMDSQGITIAAKQGAAAASAATSLETTVTGTVHKVIGVVGTAAAVTIYNGTNDPPATWDKLFFWCDQNVQLQLMDFSGGSGTQVVIAVAALDPFVMSDGDMVAAVNETPIGVTETTLRPIDRVLVGNYGTQTANYILVIVD